jgi:transposase
MRRFVEGIDRGQATLFPECLEDWIDADNPVRVVDAFVEKLITRRLPTSARPAEQRSSRSARNLWNYAA